MIIMIINVYVTGWGRFWVMIMMIIMIMIVIKEQ